MNVKTIKRSKLRTRVSREKEKFWKDSEQDDEQLEQTGEGVFEVTKNLDQLRVKEKGQHDTFGPTRTLAEQKMDRNIKKLSKSIKIAKWNPNDWNIRGKLRKKINTRKWDDINVRPQWEEPSHSPPKDDGRREACETSSHPTLPRRTYQQPVLLPEKGSVFLKKSKQVFFSSLGRMHESCGTLTVSHPPVSPEPPKLPSPSTSLASSVSQEPSHTSEDSDNVVLVSSDSISISSNENVGESCEEEDTEVNNNLPHPVSDIADVFSSKIESPEQATEIVIEKEEHWDSDQMKDEEDLKTSITLRENLLTEIAKDSVYLFSDLKKWKLVHFSRLASWILERVRSDVEETQWHCVVGEEGDFQYCLTSRHVYKIKLDHVTVLLFNTE